MLVTSGNIQEVVSKLLSVPKLSIDTETTGLEWTDRLFAIVIADDKTEYYFDKREVHLSKLEPLFKTNKTWITKNAKFDMRMLYHEGFTLRGTIEDVGVQARIIRNDFYGAKSYSLDELSKRYLKKEKDKTVEKYIKDNSFYESRVSKTGEKYKSPRYDRVPIEIMCKYARLDARLTYDLALELYDRMDPDDRRVYAMECELIPVLFDMEMRGVRVDIDAVESQKQIELKDLQDAKTSFHLITGKEYDNSKSILVPIFRDAGEKIYLTKTGQASLTDDILETYTSPAAREVQKYKYHEKRISTYYDNFINLADAKGFIHPSLWQDGTRTRRFSCSEPNLQNLPKKEKEVEIRRCLVADDSDSIILSVDYSQQEYRLMMSYANEKRVIAEINSGVDVHQAIANQVNIDRDKAKTLSFSILYGSGIDNIAQMLGVTAQQAKNLRTKYYLALPKVETFQHQVMSQGRIKGYVKNWYGFKCRADLDFVYALPNHLIQSGCAEVLKLAMIKCHNLLQGTKSRMLACVHDQIYFNLNKNEMHLVPQIKSIMESVFPETNGITLRVDIEMSERSFSKSDMKKVVLHEG